MSCQWRQDDDSLFTLTLDDEGLHLDHPENALDRDVLISGVGAGNYDGTMTLAGTTSIWIVYEDGLTYITKEKPYF